MIEELIKYSMQEIEMAENYVQLSKMTSDSAVAQKLKEIAKDEIKHYDYLESLLKKEMEAGKDETESDAHKRIMDTYKIMIEDWREEVLYKINNPSKR